MILYVISDSLSVNGFRPLPQGCRFGAIQTKKTWKYKVRPVVREGDIGLVELQNGLSATIDSADIPLVSQWNWWAEIRKAGHVVGVYRNVPPKRGLHSEILGEPFVDHADGDPLNNRRSNLRVATHLENSRNRKRRKDNRAGFKGVSARYGRWRARISPEPGKRLHLGYFATALEAAQSYDRAAKKFFGEFAALNFPDYTLSAMRKHRAAYVEESGHDH